MKSKTSFCSMALMKRNFKSTWMMSVLAFLVMMVFGPYGYWKEWAALSSERVNAGAQQLIELKHMAMDVYLNAGGTVVYFMIYAIVMGSISFAYLHDRRASQMLHAMPFTRRQMFCSYFLSGWIMTVLPIMVTGVIYVITVHESCCTPILCTMYLFKIVTVTLGFAGITALNMVCGVIYLPVILFAIFGCLYVAMSSFVRSIVGFMLYGYVEYRGGLFGCDLPGENILSPITYLFENYGISMEEGFRGGFSFLWYFLYAGILILIAYWAYERKPMEAAGDFLTKNWLKLFFSIGFSVCASIVAIYIIVGLEYSAGSVEAFGIWNILLVAGITFVIFILSSMFIRRSIHVRQKTIMVTAAVVSVVIMIGIGCLQYDVFGFVNYIPEISQVKSMQLSGANLELVEETNLEEIQNAMGLHKKILENKGVRVNPSEGNSINIFIDYELKNGKLISRRYSITYTRDDLQDENSVVYYIQQNYNNLNRFKEIFMEKEPDEGYLAAGNGAELVDAKAEEINEAFLKDLENGAIPLEYYEYSWGFDQKQAETKVYEIAINLIYRSGFNFACYGNVSEYGLELFGDTVSNELSETRLCFYINEDCTNLLKLAKDKGIDVEKWVVTNENGK